MNRPIAISLSPNTELDDVSRAWHALRHSKLWADGEILAEVQQKINALFPNYYVALTSSGRNALASLLQELKIQAGDEVLLQAFTCIAVPAAVAWAGAKPVYVDINKENYNLDPADLERKITPKTKALIIQHTFGISADVQKIVDIARQKNILIIEDCAHALGATYNNQLLGTFGDIAFLSFGRDKCVSSVFGGAVLSKNSELIKKIQHKQQQLTLPPRQWIKQQLFHPIALNWLVPCYFTAGLGKAGLVVLQKLSLLSKAVERGERTGTKPSHFNYQYSPALAYLLSHQLDKLHRYTERRRAIAERYMQGLHSLSTITLPTIAVTSNPSWLRFPILVNNPQELRLKARQKHMLLGDWYDAPLVPASAKASAFGYTMGMCPQAEDAAQHVINLPTYPLITDEQVENIIDFIKQNA